MPKNALIISGGGAKGAFAVGVIKYIITNTAFRFDIVCGTSTGSLITPFAALGDVASLEKIYTTTTTRDIVLKGDVLNRFMNSNSLFDSSPLKELVRKTYTKDIFDRLINSGIRVFFATVCLQTGKVVHFSNQEMPAADGYEVMRIQDYNEFVNAIVASSNQPVFMQPVKIRSTDQHPRQYVDGGVREYAPARVAIDNGATDVFVIYLSPKEMATVNEEYKDLMSILMRTMGLFSTDVGENDVFIPTLYNNSILYLEEVKGKMKADGLSTAQIDAYFDSPINPFRDKKVLKLHVFYPDYLLKGPGGLEFDPAEMKKYLDHGFEVAEKYFGPSAPVIV